MPVARKTTLPLLPSCLRVCGLSQFQLPFKTPAARLRLPFPLIYQVAYGIPLPRSDLFDLFYTLSLVYYRPT